MIEKFECSMKNIKLIPEGDYYWAMYILCVNKTQYDPKSELDKEKIDSIDAAFETLYRLAERRVP
jgi:hypothetical protein